jgi:NTP pyrophosphatase (non-canonical NTP hydrolase)
MWDQVGQLHAYHGDVSVEVRLLKLTEEVGEVADAFLGVRGLNKRKGVCRSREDLLDELADVNHHCRGRDERHHRRRGGGPQSL